MCSGLRQEKMFGANSPTKVFVYPFSILASLALRVTGEFGVHHSSLLSNVGLSHAHTMRQTSN